jgi:hypothetical protein
MFCVHRPGQIVRPAPRLPVLFALQPRYIFSEMPIRRANPVTPGIIIAATIVVAAGIAIYENEQIRLWLDERRRRIAIALHDIGDNISPAPSERGFDARSASSAETNRQRRLQIVRRNRAALIQRAREEGISVDLDELAAIGREPEMEERRSSTTTFDDFLRSDGTLKIEIEKSQATGSAAQSSNVNSSLRHRGLGARGLASGAAFANPFDDEAQLLFDRELIAPSPGEHPVSQATTSTVRSISPRPASTIPSIIDIPITETLSTNHPEQQSQYKTDDELEAEIEEAIRRSLQDVQPAESTYSPPDVLDATSNPWSPPTTHTLSPDTTADLTGLDDSLYALPSPRSVPEHLLDHSLEHQQPMDLALSPDTIFDSALPHQGTLTPRGAGTLTPTSEVSAFSSALSSALQSTSAADEVEPLDVRSLASDDDVFDARSEAGMSDAYSFVGASTPGSWTDVDTDAEGEEMNGSRAARI